VREDRPDRLDRPDEAPAAVIDATERQAALVNGPGGGRYSMPIAPMILRG